MTLKGTTLSGVTAATADAAGGCVLTLARPRTAAVPPLRAALARGAPNTAGSRRPLVAILTTGVAILRHPLVAPRNTAVEIPLPHADTRTSGAATLLHPLVALGPPKTSAATPTVLTTDDLRPLDMKSLDLMLVMVRLTAGVALHHTATRAPSTLSMKATGVLAAAAATVDHRLLADSPSIGQCLTPCTRPLCWVHVISGSIAPSQL